MKLKSSSIMPFSMKRKPKQTLKGSLHDQVKAETMEEYAMESPDKIIEHRMLSNSDLSKAQVTKIPPVVNSFNYIKNMESDLQPPWFIKVQEILRKNNKDFPDTVSITRAYIDPFLVEHSKHDSNSFPCVSPQGQCQSELLGNFRCRALLLPNQIATGETMGYCYLCHLFRTNSLYIDFKNGDLQDIYQINAFTVHVNVPGEYKLEYCLPGPIDGTVALFGLFPIYNRENYKAIVRPDDLRKWVESDTVVFRLPQEVSGQI